MQQGGFDRDGTREMYTMALSRFERACERNRKHSRNKNGYMRPTKCTITWGLLSFAILSYPILSFPVSAALQSTGDCITDIVDMEPLTFQGQL
jgi:hypothetical protein